MELEWRPKSFPRNGCSAGILTGDFGAEDSAATEMPAG